MKSNKILVSLAFYLVAALAAQAEVEPQAHSNFQGEEMAARVKLVESLLKTPDAKEVTRFDEQPATADWLLKPPTTQAWVQVLPGRQNQSAQIMVGNGLISRTFLVSENLACISLRRSDKDVEFVRAIKPEVRFRVNGGDWIEVGGLTGALDKSFLTRQWLSKLETKAAAFRFAGMTIGPTLKPYEWQPKCNAPSDVSWPANGVRVTFHFVPPPGAAPPLNGLLVDVHYEIYDGLPALMKTFTVQNRSSHEIVVNQINGEYLAVPQDNVPLLHCESDYSFAMANISPGGCSEWGIKLPSGENAQWYDYYVGDSTTKWEHDPDWGSAGSVNPAEDGFQKNPQLSLLVSKPAVGPGLAVVAGGKFEAFRTFEILNDTSEKERSFLAQRRFYRKLAPQVNEHQLDLHCPTRNPSVLKAAIGQMREVGFERLQIDYPAGISYEDISADNIKWLKDICDYGQSKGIRIGAYELMLASRSRGPVNDCIHPESVFGQSTCGGSKWAQTFYSNMWVLVDSTGLGSFDPDGPFHGDPCASTNHPGHRGLEDSQWTQWQYMCRILHEGQKHGLYLTAPDWYFLNGGVCTGMGYREATDNLNIVLQTMLYRQYIFDGTYAKTPSMGWVNLNTDVLRGGLEANLDAYERQLFGLLGSGAEVWVRGKRLYDGPQSKAMMLKWVAWYHKYRNIIQGDIIHLRRPNGRSLDYYLHVNPDNQEKGMLLVFNPAPEAISQTLDVPLYYTGLTETAHIREQEGAAKTYRLNRDYSVRVPVNIPANGYTWLVIE